MRITTTTVTVHCDRCSTAGNPEYPNRALRRFSFTGPPRTLKSESITGVEWCLWELNSKGWWLGRKWHLCPPCKVAEGKVSKAGKAVNDLEPLG